MKIMAADINGQYDTEPVKLLQSVEKFCCDCTINGGKKTSIVWMNQPSNNTGSY